MLALVVLFLLRCALPLSEPRAGMVWRNTSMNQKYFSGFMSCARYYGIDKVDAYL